MKKRLSILLVVILSLLLFGCSSNRTSTSVISQGTALEKQNSGLDKEGPAPKKPKVYKKAITLVQLQNEENYTEDTLLLESNVLYTGPFKSEGESYSRLGFIKHGIIAELTPFTDVNFEFTLSVIKSSSIETMVSHTVKASLGAEFEGVSISISAEEMNSITSTQTKEQQNQIVQNYNLTDYEPCYKYKVVLVADYQLNRYLANGISVGYLSAIDITLLFNKNRTYTIKEYLYITNVQNTELVLVRTESIK